MNGYTPQQLQAIKTWTEERDQLHRDIAVASTELDEKNKLNTQAGLDLAAHHTDIAESKGRLAELLALEDRHRTSVSTDVAELEAKKSRLEVECASKEAESKTHDAHIAQKLESIGALSTAHDKMSDQAKIVDQVVGQVIEKSTSHIAHMHERFTELDSVVATVITKGNENIEQANIVIPKMARFIFDQQRPLPVRRIYPIDHPKYEAPETDVTVG